MVDLNDMNRAHGDGWPTQSPGLPYPPTSTSQKTDASLLGRPKQERPHTPVYPHPQSGNDNQLPPIRNLVPNLWEPGTSKSSQQISPDEGQNGTPIYRLRPVGPAWSGRPTNTNDTRNPRPQLEANHHENECNRDTPRQIKESNKRPPPSPIERTDHSRTAPSNGIINSNRGSISHAPKPPQTSNHTTEKSIVRPRSTSEATKPTGEPPGIGPQSSHQELLRDPVSKPWSGLSHGYLTCTLVLY